MVDFKFLMMRHKLASRI